ncbi:MAG: histidine phosphatase family protein [Methanoregula sp.]
MKPGDFVLDILKEAPKNRKTIVIIRHSKRNSFEGIPDHLRESVGITPEGILMAREFGASLGKILPGKPLFLGHTIARRCRMTAESIRDGYPLDTPARILGCEPEIKSPVINLDKLIAIRDELGWREGIRKWLDQEIPGDILHDPHQYSDYVLRNLLSCPYSGEQDLLIAIAHDITLFPIISSVFGEKVKAIEFLNGIVITADTNRAELQFADTEFSLKADRYFDRSNR